MRKVLPVQIWTAVADPRHLLPVAVDRLFEGIDSERVIAWRLADSLALRRFVGIGLDEQTPDHSTISRTRRVKRRDERPAGALDSPRGARGDVFLNFNLTTPTFL